MSTEMLLSFFGITIEGRKQSCAIFRRLLITQFEEAITKGKPIVVLAANGNDRKRGGYFYDADYITCEDSEGLTFL